MHVYRHFLQKRQIKNRYNLYIGEIVRKVKLCADRVHSFTFMQEDFFVEATDGICLPGYMFMGKCRYKEMRYNFLVPLAISGKGKERE